MLLLAVVDDDGAFGINNIAWVFAPLAAAASARITSTNPGLIGHQRRGWRLVAMACLAWCGGRLLAHCTLMALTLFAALYYSWTQRWLASWMPMLLVAIGTAEGATFSIELPLVSQT